MSPIVKLYLIVIAISTIEVVFTAYMKSPKRLGRAFEKNIANSLKSLEKQGIYGKVLRNIYLPKNEYETSEIDVLFITTYGLFILECKNYNGWIFGRENEHQWTVSLPRGKGRSKKYKFFNPLRQNLSHIKPLNDYLTTQFSEKQINLYPIVVFSHRGTMKKIFNNSHQPVFYREDMLNYIKEISKQNNPCLTQVQVDSLYEDMKQFTKVNKETKKQHIENIKKYKAN